MIRALAIAAVACALLLGCGDNLVPPPQDVADVAGELAALPGVHDVTAMPTGAAGFTYYVLHFSQPVDHAEPSGATFLQEVSLLHKDTTSPMIVHTSGYWDYYRDSQVELTYLLGGNQISIEHRYFAGSRPESADWSKLTIEQMAEDEHAIVTSLKRLYTGAYISTGGSKGGMTAIFYRRFFPDDVAGTVPYVAPISFGAPDPRYPAYLAQVGNATCRQHVRDLATELLANRRAAMEAAAEAQGNSFTRVALRPAVESAIISFEWSFWQYFGITQCDGLPGISADDATLFKLLDRVSPPSDSDDDQTGLFDAYYYQAYLQLGYPADGTDAYLKPYEMYGDADYAGSLPTTQPTYDGGVAMHDVQAFVAGSDKFVFVYGQWDPWSGGQFDLTGTRDSLLLVNPEGTHGSRLTDLPAGDRAAAYAKLEAWTGVSPKAASVAFSDRVTQPRPRMHALRAVDRSH
jgi:hypothetical protein